MRKVKWIFFAYLAAAAVLVAGLALAPAVVPKPPLDPDTLYLAYIADIKSMDPIEIGDVPSAQINGNIYECLYNYDYEARPFKLIPELAAGMPEVSEDGKTYTIRLRKGVYYYDPDGLVFPEKKGPEVKAGDFVYAWKRVLDFNVASVAANHLAHLDGADEWQAYTEKAGADRIDWDRPLKGAVALDDYTLQVKLHEKFPQFIYVLAHLPSAPVCRAAVEKHGKEYARHPVGTGPYGMHAADHITQVSIKLHANPFYRGRPDANPGDEIAADRRLPRTKFIQFRYFDEDLPRWFTLRQGLLDYMGTIPKETFSQAVSATGELTEEMKRDGITVVSEPDPTIRYFGFNMRHPVIGRNKPLRQAMSMAFDRQKFVKVYFSGLGVVANSVIPPGFECYDPNLNNPNARYDLAAAREKMSEAQRVNGGPIPRLTLLMPGIDTFYRQMGEYFQSQMAKIGLEVEVDYTNWARFLDIVEKKKTAPIYLLGWQADWPDEQNLFQLFWSKNISEGGLNSFNYENPEYDRIYERAVTMDAEPERLALYKRLQAIINEDCPTLLLYSDIIAAPKHAWIAPSLRLSDYPHGRFAYIELDGRKRAEWHRGKER